MAVDKLVDSNQLDSDLTSVANAIRTKGGTSASLAFPSDFVQAIADIPTGGGSIPHVFSAEYTPLVNAQALSIALDFTYCPIYVYIYINLEDLPSTRDVEIVSSIRLNNNTMSDSDASWATSVGRRTNTIKANNQDDYWSSTPNGTITPTLISLDVSNKSCYFLAGLTYHIIAVEVQPK